jgi:hypothetical protein
MKNGLGTDQIRKYQNVEEKISAALKDGNWHRAKELKENTGLNAATLSKHLKNLLAGGSIEKYVDTAKAAPFPVRYRLVHPDNYYHFSIPAEDPDTTTAKFREAMSNAYETLSQTGKLAEFQQALDISLGSMRVSFLEYAKKKK